MFEVEKITNVFKLEEYLKARENGNGTKAARNQCHTDSDRTMISKHDR